MVVGNTSISNAMVLVGEVRPGLNQAKVSGLTAR